MEDLNSQEQQWSIELSKQALHKYILDHNILKISPQNVPEKLLAQRSCFVTYRKNNELRGCIGSITATRCLYLEIIDQSISAAVKDPRFSPIHSKELPTITTEITVLSSPQVIQDVNSFVVGKHGIIFSLHQYNSVFLPQVAIEQSWSREETLIHLSLKAGLKKNDWKNKEASFQIFTAQKITE